MPPARRFPPKVPEWVWPGHVPRNCMTLIVGRDGVGKSTLLTMLAAQASSGELSGRPERVMLALIEDGRAEVTSPRLEVAGADVDLISYTEIERLLLPRDLDALADELAAGRPDILMLDPLGAIVQNISHGSGRTNIDRLLGITERLGVTVIAAHHLIKSADVIGGGAGVSACARAIYLFRPAPLMMVPQILQQVVLEDATQLDTLGVLVSRKNSYACAAAPLLLQRQTRPHPADPTETVPSYRILGELRADLGGELEESRRNTLKEKAKNFIIRHLVGRPCQSDELSLAALDLFRPDTFESARAELKQEGLIESYHDRKELWWRIAIPDTIAPGP